MHAAPAVLTMSSLRARVTRILSPHPWIAPAWARAIAVAIVSTLCALSAGIGWQVPRVPGLGDVDWRIVFRALYRAGYEGDCIIEHEDRRFEGTDQLVKRGFLLARNILRPFIPKGY